jgi:hypothetical protein
MLLASRVLIYSLAEATIEFAPDLSAKSNKNDNQV